MRWRCTSCGGWFDDTECCYLCNERPPPPQAGASARKRTRSPPAAVEEDIARPVQQTRQEVDTEHNAVAPPRFELTPNARVGTSLVTGRHPVSFAADAMDPRAPWAVALAVMDFVTNINSAQHPPIVQRPNPARYDRPPAAAAAQASMAPMPAGTPSVRIGPAPQTVGMLQHGAGQRAIQVQQLRHVPLAAPQPPPPQSLQFDFVQCVRWSQSPSVNDIDSAFARMHPTLSGIQRFAIYSDALRTGIVTESTTSQGVLQWRAAASCSGPLAGPTVSMTAPSLSVAASLPTREARPASPAAAPPAALLPQRPQQQRPCNREEYALLVDFLTCVVSSPSALASVIGATFSERNPALSKAERADVYRRALRDGLVCAGANDAGATEWRLTRQPTTSAVVPPPQPRVEVVQRPPTAPRSSADSADIACTICLEAPRRHAFQPCGHVVCCEVCSVKVQRCPTCRGDIKTRLKVFL